MTDLSIQQQLAAEFAETHSKQGLTYITGEQVTSRLNEVLGWDGWSFRVLDHGYHAEADELWSLGELTIGSVVKQQFGSQKPNRYTAEHRQHPNEIIDLGFDLKGAATDALKKCASLIGVGLYLHERQGQPASQPARPSRAARPARAAPEEKKKRPTFMEFMATLGFTADEVLAIAHERYETNDPNSLKLEQKQRLQLALEERRKKAPAA